MINSISEKKWNRLTEHLELLEVATGRGLILKNRFSLESCPIINFAPLRNEDGSKFDGCTSNGILYYYNKITGTTEYPIYTKRDSSWWRTLKGSTKVKVTLAIEKWIKERRENILGPKNI